jgi:hypothetical protein
MMENDAIACFDRMLPSLVTLSLRAHDVPIEIAKLVGTALVKMRHRIKTKLGISKQRYSHSRDHPVHGTGQGSAGSMAFWLLISTVLFGIMRKIAHGLQFTDPTRTDTLQRTMEGFVNNTDVAVNDAQTLHAPEHLAQALQDEAQHWEHLLFISGRKLELNKCFFHALIWQFNADGKPHLTPKDQLPCNLMITQGNNEAPTAIEQKDCSEPHKTLGLMKAPNRSQKGEIKRLQAKCNKHAQATLSNSVTASDSTVACRVCHLTSIGCSLSTTCVTLQDLIKRQGRAIGAFLATSGCNRNMVFSPRNHGGLGMVPLMLLQGQKGIQMLRRHILHQTELGLQMRIDLAWIQQEAGTLKPILESTHINLEHLEDGWIAGVRRFLKLVKAEIRFLNMPKPQTCRQEDACLMGLFRQNDVSTTELYKLNRCRLCFQAARMSDIANIAGTHLCDNVLLLD